MSSLSNRLSVKGWLSLGLLYGLDRISKAFICQFLHHPVEIIPGFFSLHFITNTGLAFGFLSHLPPSWMNPLLIAIGLIITAFLIHLLTSTEEPPLPRFGLLLLLAGALGNMTDRLIWGHVVDFLDFSIKSHHWPAFNFADSYITVGIILYLSGAFLKTHASQTD